MNSYPYITGAALLSGASFTHPAELDFLSFEYEGVTVHAYGVLHALTGGTNRAYVSLTNDTIANAPGLKLGEKGMTVMYKGLDGELDDWLQVPLKDAFRFPLSLLGSPWRLARLVATVVRELITKDDRFGASGVRRLEDIGGSPAFHAMAPGERRRVAGFPDARDYLMENLLRRQGRGRMAPIQFPDTDWSWLPLIEHYANIPCRSIHMLEYAVALARLKGLSEVSLFVGEVHNSDMGWYQAHAETLDGLPTWVVDEVREIRRLAKEHANLVVAGKPNPRKFAYAGAMLAGLAIPVFGYTAVVRWALNPLL